MVTSMSNMKELDRLTNEVADYLAIIPDMVNICQVPGGWQADVNVSGCIVTGDVVDGPIVAMQNLLTKCQKIRNARAS